MSRARSALVHSVCLSKDAWGGTRPQAPGIGGHMVGPRCLRPPPGSRPVWASTLSHYYLFLSYPTSISELQMQSSDSPT